MTVLETRSDCFEENQIITRQSIGADNMKMVGFVRDDSGNSAIRKPLGVRSFTFAGTSTRSFFCFFTSLSCEERLRPGQDFVLVVLLTFIKNGMARKPRVEYPEAVYRVICRANQRQVIFRGDPDRKFYRGLGKLPADLYGLGVYAYVLMCNHLLIETGSVPLSKIIQGVARL